VTNEGTNGVAMSLLELLIAAKNIAKGSIPFNITSYSKYLVK
jgi:hypothetical protein